MQASEGKQLIPTLREIVTIIFRHWIAFVATFAIVMIGFVLTGQFSSKYAADMKIVVSKQRVDPVVTTGQDSTPHLEGLGVREEDLNTESIIIKGDDLLRQVVLESGLISVAGHSAAEIERVVRRVQRHLDVSVLPKTDLISVRYESHDADESHRVLVKLAGAYMDHRRHVKEPNSQVAYFSREMRIHEYALEDAQQRLVDFTHRTGVISADLQRELTVRQLEEMKLASLQNNAEISNLVKRAQILEHELDTAPTRVATDERESDNAQLLDQLNSTLLTLRLKRTDLLNKYDEKYRAVQDVNREIATTQSMIDAQMATPVHERTSNANPTRLTLESQLASTHAESEGLQAKRQVLANSSESLSRAAQLLSQQEMEQDALQNKVKTEKTVYQLYVDKLEQARMTQSLDAGGILNVGVAEDPSTPALPERSQLEVLIAALFSSILLGLGATLLAEVLDPTVRNSSELEELAGVPLFAEFGPMGALEGGKS